MAKRQVKAKKVKSRVKVTQLTQNELKKNQAIRNGKLVQELLMSEVWEDILEQEINEMILHITGFQSEAGNWVAGHDTKISATNDELRYYAGYKAALIELHTNILKYVDLAKKLEKEEQKPELVDQMSEDYDGYGNRV